jgi:DNA topoisomerase-2
MPLWSLTQERVDKLLRQISDKEIQMDALIKLSKEDLWRRDLDDFIAEWRFQLEDEQKRQRNIAKTAKNRRTSKKFKLGPVAKKRKGQADDSGDDDFEIAKPSKKQTKITAFKAPRATVIEDLPKTNASVEVSKTVQKGSTGGASNDPHVVDDGNDDDEDDDGDLVLLSKKPKAEAKQKATKPDISGHVHSKSKSKTTALTKDSDTMARPRQEATIADSDVEEVASKPPARQARAVTKKPISYSADTDSDNGDDLLGDVSNMVKGLPTANSESRPIFSNSASRPISSAGYKPASRAPLKVVDDLSDDETDYTKLVPQQSPRRSILVTAKENNITDDEEDDEDMDIRPVPSRRPPKAAPPPQKPIKATASTTKAKPQTKATKKAAATAPTKKNAQSPVAKAYAKRLAKKKVVDSDDDIDAMADDILDSAGSGEDFRKPSPPAQKASGRPARRAATVTKKATYTFDDDDDDDSDEVQSDEGASATYSDSE